MHLTFLLKWLAKESKSQKLIELWFLLQKIQKLQRTQQMKSSSHIFTTNKCQKMFTYSWKFVIIFRWITFSFPEASHRIFTRRNSRLMIAFCWAVPFLIILPSLTRIWGKHGLDCKTRSCTIIDANDGSLSFKKFLMSVGVAIPSLILIVIHLMIYEKVCL